MDKFGEITSKTKSKIEGAISIAYLLIVALLLKGTSWFIGDEIDSRLGERAGAFAAYIAVPLSFILAAMIVFICSYFVISILFGKEAAEEIVFRWRKRKPTETKSEQRGRFP